jgi:hypothetical protein
MVDATDFSPLIAQAHLCAGNDHDVRYQKEVGDCEFKWVREYGNVWRQHGCLGVSEHSIEYPPLLIWTKLQRDRLVVADPKALRYILHKP